MHNRASPKRNGQMGPPEKRKIQSKWRAWTSRQKLRLLFAAILLAAVVLYLHLSSLYGESMHTTASNQDLLCVDVLREKQLPVEAEGAIASLLSSFNSTSRLIRVFAWDIERYLVPWKGLYGIKKGIGSSGMIKNYTLQAMGSVPEVMACCSHVIVVAGKIYFRYGGFVNDNEKLLRLHESIRLMQAAITKYELTDVKAEFFLNTCRWPLGFDNSISPMTIGHLRTVYPILSTRLHPASTDILIPDPIDTDQKGDRSYIESAADPVPWSEKVPKAVFRSDEVNFEMKEDFWAVSPRLRLHRMTDARPDLLDARLTRFHAPLPVVELLKEGDVVEEKDLDLTKKSEFKYEMVVDGVMGATTVCSVLSSARAMIRQESEIVEFFDSLLVPGVHYLPTSRYFNDLFQVIEWARDHDGPVQEMVAEANKMAQAVCSREGRVDYWGILLHKYQKAMENTSYIQPPSKLCTTKPHTAALDVKFPRSCDAGADPAVRQAPCVYFCATGSIPSDTWDWVSADSLSDTEIVTP